MVPQLAENWEFHDKRGYKMRKELYEREAARKEDPARQNEPPEYQRSRIMLVRTATGWTYQLQAKSSPNQQFAPVPIPPGEIEPPVNLRAKALPREMEDQLCWEDVKPELLVGPAAERVKELMQQFSKQQNRQ